MQDDGIRWPGSCRSRDGILPVIVEGALQSQALKSSG
jgi:hypothetical protein